jgi:PAS domain S-box
MRNGTRYLTEWSPNAILVQQEGKIRFTNPAGRRLFAADTNEELFGKDIVDLVSREEQESMRQGMNQTLQGAKLQIPRTRLLRLDGEAVFAEAWLGKIIWDEKSAVQIILRALTNIESGSCPSL